MTTQKANDFSAAPNDYPLCLNHQCPKASTCLRQLVEQTVSDNTRSLVVINPKYQSKLTGDCPDYRSNKTVLYAKGFIKALENLNQKQFPAVVHDLTSTFSQRTYYRIRKGERLLSLAEQQTVAKIFKRHGVTTSIEFDSYVEDYDW